MADITKPIIIKSPIIHTCGSNCFIIHPETDSSQVMVSETTRLDEQLETINRAIAGSSAIRFTNSIAERNTLTNMLPGDRVWVYDAQEDPDVGTAISAMYIWTPEKVWKRVGEAAAINIKDFVKTGGGISCEANKIQLNINELTEIIKSVISKYHTHVDALPADADELQALIDSLPEGAEVTVGTD